MWLKIFIRRKQNNEKFAARKQQIRFTWKTQLNFLLGTHILPIHTETQYEVSLDHY